MLYYQERADRLGEQLLSEVKATVLFLTRYPEAGTQVYGPIRRLFIPRFPYYLLYRPVGGGVLRILAFAHQSRHPRYWSGRM